MRRALQLVGALLLALVCVFAADLGTAFATVDCSADPVPAECAQPLTADDYQQGVADTRWVLVTGFGLLMVSNALTAVIVRRFR